MISPAVRVPNSTERSISSAVSASRVPWSAERWTSEASSVELRAERSSSCGSTPSRRTSALAEPLSSRISQPLAAVKPRWKPCVARAVSIGRAIAKFLGTSSPKSIVSTVLRISAMAIAIGRTAPSGMPMASKRTVDEAAIAGSARKPMARLVTVMPDLGARQLGGEAAQRLLHTLRSGVTGRGGAVDLVAVDGDEGELGGDEHAAGEDQEQGDREEQPFGHE